MKRPAIKIKRSLKRVLRLSGVEKLLAYPVIRVAKGHKLQLILTID